MAWRMLTPVTGNGTYPGQEALARVMIAKTFFTMKAFCTYSRKKSS